MHLPFVNKHSWSPEKSLGSFQYPTSTIGRVGPSFIGAEAITTLVSWTPPAFRPSSLESQNGPNGVSSKHGCEGKSVSPLAFWDRFFSGDSLVTSVPVHFWGLRPPGKITHLYFLFPKRRNTLLFWLLRVYLQLSSWYWDSPSQGFVRFCSFYIMVYLFKQHWTHSFSSVQSLSCVQLFTTSWTAVRQAFLSIMNSRSLLKLMSIELAMLSNHLILCRPLLLPPSIILSIRVFSDESVLHIRWPKYWSFSFNISPSNEYSGLISFRIDWLDLLAVQGTLKSLLQHHSSKASVLQHSAFFIVHLSYLYTTTGKTKALTRRTFVGKVMCLLFNMLSRMVIGEGNGTPLQYSCLENPMDGRAW